MKARLVFFVYNALLLLALPFIFLFIVLRWPRRFWSGSLHLSERLGSFSQAKKQQWKAGAWWWIHAASLGELKALVPLFKQLKSQARASVLLSVVTPEALVWAKESDLAPCVIAAPLDLPWIVRRVLCQVRPISVITVESEFWPNFLRESRSFGAHVALINGRISHKSFRRYLQIRTVLRQLWETIDVICARETEDAERFRQLGVDPARLETPGNMKYDIHLNPSSEVPSRRGPVVLVVGSSREGEEALLLPAIESVRKRSGVKCIVAPRHLERVREIEPLLRKTGAGCVLKSQQDWTAWLSQPEFAYLIWDSFGDLVTAYGAGDIAIIGGSFVGKGGQNPIEPAALGMPVVWGPSMENFREVSEHLKREGGALACTLDSFQEDLQRLVEDASQRRAMGQCARGVIVRSQGATQRTLAILEKLHGA